MRLTQLLMRRSGRALLMAASVLVGVGFLVFGEGALTKALGAVLSLMITLLIKAVSELSVESASLRNRADRTVAKTTDLKHQLTRIEGSTARLASEQRQQAEHFRSEHQRVFELLTGQGEKLSATATEITRVGSEGLRVESRLTDLQAEAERRFTLLQTTVDDLIQAQKPVRRHAIREVARLRELGLQDSLDSLEPRRVDTV